jgi:LDH2 family malate/lactate/ureidoglycolate dehydrogenase
MILERFKVPEKDQVRVSDSALRETVTRIFEKLGVTPEDAADAADVLVMTDLRGVETHGVSNMLRAYVRDYRAGKLDPSAPLDPADEQFLTQLLSVVRSAAATVNVTNLRRFNSLADAIHSSPRKDAIGQKRP